MRKRHIPPAILILIVLLILPFLAPQLVVLEDVTLFLTITGLTFGLIAAFKINQSYERFVAIRQGVSQEVSSLYNLVLIVSKLKDKETLEELKSRIREYVSLIPKTEWSECPKNKKLKKAFHSILELVSNIKFKNDLYKAEIFDEILDEIESLLTYRTQQMVSVRAKTTRLQWGLLIFLSGSLITILALLSNPAIFISTFTIAIMNLSIFFILIVVFDLDNLSFSAAEVGDEPYIDLLEDIKEF